MVTCTICYTGIHFFFLKKFKLTIFRVHYFGAILAILSPVWEQQYMEFQFRKERPYMFQIWKRNRRRPENYICAGDRRGRPRSISRQKFTKRTCILSTPRKPYFFHSVHSAIGSRINGMIFRSFRKRNSSPKNTNTVYSEYCDSGIVPKERALNFVFENSNSYYSSNVHLYKHILK